ncbi:SFRICE021517.2 [Gryllus bimaculatus]|nr:SFRICE021517.2 [Gryllus bimaculatus]
MIWASAFSLLILSTFSGVFTSFTLVPKRGPELITLADFNARYKLVYSFPRTADMIRSNYNWGSEDYKTLVSKLVSIDLLPQFGKSDLLRSLETGEAVLIDAETTLELWWRRLDVVQNGELLFRIIPDCLIAPAYVSFTVRKDMPYADEYSSMVQRLFEGGIVDKITRDSWHKMGTRGYLKVKNIFTGMIIDEVKIMNLIHVRESFFLLGCGICISIFIAMAEILIGRAICVRK